MKKKYALLGKIFAAAAFVLALAGCEERGITIYDASNSPDGKPFDLFCGHRDISYHLSL